jgi:hypothetical protein
MMSKPPPSTPHSDMDGIHQDERPNTEVAAELGQSAKTLQDIRQGAHRQAPGGQGDRTRRPHVLIPRLLSHARTDRSNR